jgi:hypothetical protein
MDTSSAVMRVLDPAAIVAQKDQDQDSKSTAM